MSQYINPPTPTAPQAPAQRGSTRSGMALASMILGIVGFVPCIGFITTPIALILGIVALVVIKKSNGTVHGKGLAITGIILSLLSFVLIGVFTAMRAKELKNNPPSTRSSAAATGVMLAERNISSSSGQIGFGNTPKAEELANQFATQMKLLRDSFFTGTSKDSISVSKGRFLTHCEKHEESCVFLVHIPSLRKFEGDAKDSLCDLAWAVAVSTLQESNYPEGKPLIVGVKGFLLYEQIMVGEYHSAPETASNTITSRGKNNDILEPYFPVAKAAAKPTAESPEEPEAIPTSPDLIAE